MKITFKDFGAIHSGEIRLSPLTILCGENNTGKTYAMYAVCGLLGLRFPRNLSILKPHIEALQTNGSIELDLEELLRASWSDVQDKISHCFCNAMPQFFSADQEIFNKSVIRANNPVEDALSFVRKSEQRVSSEASGGKILMQAEKPSDSLILKVTLTGKLPVQIVEETLSFLIGKTVFSPWGGRVILLPAERAGLNLFYRELNRQRTALLHHASKPQLDIRALFEDMVARYPQPIADYIDILNDLSNLKKRKGVYRDLAADIQRTILNIKKYQIDRDGNISFTPKKSEKSLNLHLGSSTVKSIFGLWFYLEHLSQEGDVLMVDEPELNLHPSYQRAMACVIARLVNRGTKVILTTHSDYFVRQINSLIMLGNAGEKGRQIAKKHKVNEEALLDLEKVVGYVFKSNTIELMEIDKDEGIIAETFDREILDLNNESEEIYWETSSKSAL